MILQIILSASYAVLLWQQVTIIQIQEKLNIKTPILDYVILTFFTICLSLSILYVIYLPIK